VNSDELITVRALVLLGRVEMPTSREIIPAAEDNSQRLNLVGRVTACPERSRMGAHRRPLAACRGLRALPFPVAAMGGVSVASLLPEGVPICALL